MPLQKPRPAPVMITTRTAAVGVGGADGLGPLGQHRVVERVKSLGLVQGDRGHAVRDVVEDCFLVRHAGLLRVRAFYGPRRRATKRPPVLYDRATSPRRWRCMASPPEAIPNRTDGPQRPGGQGLDPHQFESGNLAIYELLTRRRARRGPTSWPHAGSKRTAAAYEAWALRGMVRWAREPEPAATATASSRCGAKIRSSGRTRVRSRRSKRNWRPAAARRAVHRARGDNASLRLRAHLAALR